MSRGSSLLVTLFISKCNYFCEIDTFAIVILFMNVIFPNFVGPGKIFVTAARLDVLNFYAKEKKLLSQLNSFSNEICRK